MLRGRRGWLCAVLAVVLVCAAAAPASAVRSNRGAKPSVTILTKDQRAALKTRKLSLRVGVGIAPARIRIRGLGLDFGPRPVRIVAERKIRLGRPHTRVVNLKLTKRARQALQAARDACRDLRVSAFVAARRLGRKRDDQRTTLVRHSKTLRHGRTDCGAPTAPGGGGFGSSDSVTLPPAFGGAEGFGPDPFTPGPPPTFDPNEPVTVRAGSAARDITPPVGTPMFAYTARSQVFGPDQDKFLQIIADPDENLYAKTFAASRGIHTRVLSRALVLESGGNKFALVHVDLGGIPYAMTQEVLKRIPDTGITGDGLLLSATHTHSSSGAIWSADNMGYGFVGGDVYDPRIFDLIAESISQSIRDANARLTPARIGVGTAELRGASSNRNFEPFQRNADVPPDPAAARAVSVNPRVTVIRADDVEGRPLGAWSNFAIHPTSFGDSNLLFSGDNASTTERFVEEAIARDGTSRGASPAHPPVNVWTNSAEGDISPRGEATVDPNVPATVKDQNGRDVNNIEKFLETSWTSQFGSANMAGGRVAAGIYSAWLDAGIGMRGSPPIDIRRTFMAFDGSTYSYGGEEKPVGPSPVLGWGGIAPDEATPTGKSDGFCAPFPDFAGPGQGNKFPLLQAPGAAPNIHPVSLMRIGPLAIAAFPTEITQQMGRRIAAAVMEKAGALAPEGAIIAGLTNSYNSYTATPEEYDACYYEGSFTLWGRHQGVKYVNLARDLAGAVYRGENAPFSFPEPPQASPGTPQAPAVRQTTNAGAVVDPPKDVQRYQKAVFRWRAGDPDVDAPRDQAFVRLERRVGSAFQTVATEDSLYDTTELRGDTQGNEVWTHTFEFHECVPLGTYRFVVRGMANKGNGVVPYGITSASFEVRRQTRIRVLEKSLTGGVARVRAEYPRDNGTPATGADDFTLTALPQRVRTGFAVLRVREARGAVSEVIALPDASRLAFTARLPAGATYDVVSVEDACGNTGS